MILLKLQATETGLQTTTATTFFLKKGKFYWDGQNTQPGDQHGEWWVPKSLCKKKPCWNHATKYHHARRYPVKESVVVLPVNSPWNSILMEGAEFHHATFRRTKRVTTVRVKHCLTIVSSS